MAVYAFMGHSGGMAVYAFMGHSGGMAVYAFMGHSGGMAVYAFMGHSGGMAVYAFMGHSGGMAVYAFMGHSGGMAVYAFMGHSGGMAVYAFMGHSGGMAVYAFMGHSGGMAVYAFMGHSGRMAVYAIMGHSGRMVVYVFMRAQRWNGSVRLYGTQRWNGMWGVCVSGVCGAAGTQFRAVWCVHSDGWTTLPSNCAPSERPSRQHACVRVCEWHRALFEWQLSPWGPCSPASPSSSSTPSSSSSSSLLARECVTAQRGVQRRRVSCTRRTDGQAAADPRVCEAFSPPPADEQACLLPCPINCVLSAFSHWSACRGPSPGCTGGGVGATPPLQHRTRQVLAAPLYGGAECPGLTEMRRCHRGANANANPPAPCPHDQQEHSYSLWAGPWSECRVRSALPSGRTRVDFSSIFRVNHQHHHQHHHHHHHHLHHHHQHEGGESWGVHIGYQTRQVRCTRNDGKNVMLSLCDHDNAPVNFRSCVMPKDCEVSDWTEWSPCSKTCRTVDQSPGYRTRKRHVKGLLIGEGKECPALEEREACNLIGDLLPLCPSYQWLLTDWGGCQILPLLGQQDHRHGNASVLCGGGIQTREVYCVRLDNGTSLSHKLRPVRRDLCSGPLPSLVQSCSITCPQLCLLSDWSEWGPCVHDECAESQGKRGGAVCPNASALQQWRSCGSGTCVHLHWAESPWGPCVLDPQGPPLNASAPEQHNATCGLGTQMREITCVKANNGVVTSKRWQTHRWNKCILVPDSVRQALGASTESCGQGLETRGVTCVGADDSPAALSLCLLWGGPMPAQVRACRVACRDDCTLSSWSAFSPCQRCGDWRSRTRTLIGRSKKRMRCQQESLYPLEEREPCPCSEFRAQPQGSWSPCLLPGLSGRTAWHLGLPGRPRAQGEGRECGQGWRYRALACLDHRGQLVEPTLCASSGLEEDLCHVACPMDCRLSEWSPWSTCSASCGWGVKVRAQWLREKAFNGGRPCPKLDLRNQVSEVLPCYSECDQHSWEVDPWSECHLNIQHASSTPAHPAHPTSTANTLNTDSPTSTANTLSTAGPNVTANTLSTTSPVNTANPDSTANTHTPSTGLGPSSYSLSNAIPTSTGPGEVLSCGEGVQGRKARCVRRGSDGQSQHVHDTLCSQPERPITSQICLLPCPTQCVTSQWSQWSTCPMACPPSALRWRGRHVLRQPQRGHACLELNQSQPCLFNSTCFSYSYSYSDWSSCQLSENAVCGQGIKTRLHRCVRSDGEPAEMSLCAERGPSDKLIISCEVSCPVNCLVSAWSPWSECSHTCGNRSQTLRSRMVLQEAGDGGQSCPAHLSQTKPCPIMPCHSWLLGHWSSCQIEGAECGEGVKVRNLTCVVHWGALVSVSRSDAAVEEERCERGQRPERDTPVQLPCSVPCPGDCHLTEWSPWSSCQLMCMDGRSFETQGRQARSRAVIVQVPENQETCPRQVYETRPCKGGVCHTYEWRTGGWRENERNVWCQRSDGVNVTGGCPSHTRPSAIRHCHPPCTKPFSFCTQSGVCGCEKGFTEVMTTHGFLDYCTRAPGPDHKKADVKTGSGQARPGRTQSQNPLREWALQAVGPDGHVRPWVYGLMAAGFVLILLIIIMSFLLCKNTKPSPSGGGHQKALTLSYDGDTDM
ncbi:thrombospondin type-1 domain-containing protein 7B-like [Sardina pilchardus]|uniref:thrombospondin type-1 domain-containing protein 7B-like n=1 Tax=Sardina pilchardus TaxID=27697 RepID=UPI002E0EDC5B